jgi:hypothetical protein
MNNHNHNLSAQNSKLAKNVKLFLQKKKSFFDFNFFSTTLQLDEKKHNFAES